MKTPLIPFTFGMASVVGFGVVYWSKPALSGTARTAAAAAPAQVFSGDEISARIKADPALIVKGEPASIADQLRSAFKLLVIDDERAGALAANSAAGFPALMEKLQTVPQGRRQLLETMLRDRWAQLDPVGGADYFKQLADSKPGDQQADDALANFIRQWGMIDFTAAAAKAGEYGGKTTRRTLREKAKLDPAGFLSWAKGPPGHQPLFHPHLRQPRKRSRPRPPRRAGSRPRARMVQRRARRTMAHPARARSR